NATLGVNDVLEIRVYQEPDLTGVFRISAEGTIDYPFCGRVKAAGLSSSALADGLTDCLKDGYLKKPQVTVFLKEYNSKKVFVFGEVQKPGTFPYEDNMSIVQAITLAGGFGKLAAKNSVIVTRLVDNEERKFKVAVEGIAEGRDKNFALQPGDIVYVPESFL
ncbi:MAG: polysaccharide biosynthesis/export family protein, partial [Myxococcales bacterium]